MHTSQTKQTLR